MDDILGYYIIRDNGDGSSSLQIFSNKEAADACYNDELETGDGWVPSEGVEILRKSHIQSKFEKIDW